MPSPSAKPPRGADNIGLAILLIGASIIVVMCMARPREASTPSTPADGARGACSVLIERQARDPASVDFIDYPDWQSTAQGDGTWSVRAHYRAKNAFGALDIYTRTCVVRQTPSGWELVRITP